MLGRGRRQGLARTWAARSGLRWESVSVQARARRERAAATAAAGAAADKTDFPVCIVGGGPVGLLLSSLLSQYKVRHCLLERRAVPTSHPQAHFINARSMEILQGHSPASFSAIVAKMPPSEYWRDFVYCYSVTGRAYSRIDHFASAPRRFWGDTPASVVHLPQNKFEGILRHEASERASECGAELMFGHAVSGYEWGQDKRPQHVVHLQESSSSTVGELQKSIKCTYLVAADGASSLTRQSLGISLGGAPALQTLMNVHFTCPGLKARLQPRPAMLYFVFNEALVAVFVAHDPESDEWVCQVPLFPPYRTSQDFDEQSLLRLLRAGLGVETLNSAPAAAAAALDIKILSVSTWTMHAEVASRFANSQDNVFLAGDAAHRFPPAGGFGMNTGLQDAHNLAWRLALVVHGASSPLLLQGYSRERRAVAQANTDLSMANYNKSLTSARLLGVDPALAKAALASVSLLPVPFAARRVAVNALLNTGLSTLAWLKDGSNTLSELRVRALKAQVDRGSSLPLLFPAEDIGFAYQDTQVPTTATPHQQVEVEMVGGTSHRLRVGARIPHVWLQLFNSETSWGPRSSVIISTVNLAALMARAHGRPETVILVFIRADRAERDTQLDQWRRTFGAASNLFKVVVVEEAVSEGPPRMTHADLQTLQQCPRHSGMSDGSVSSASAPSPTANELLTATIAEITSLTDVTGCWADSMLSAGWSHTAVAIRPDGHTAAILSSKCAALAAEEMQTFVENCSRLYNLV